MSKIEYGISENTLQCFNTMEGKMKVIRKILIWLSVILIVGGILVFLFQYMANKNLFQVLMNNSVVQGSLGVLKIMLFAVIAVILGLIILSCSFKLGSYISRRDEEKRIAAAQKEADKAALDERMKQTEAQAEERIQSAEEAASRPSSII